MAVRNVVLIFFLTIVVASDGSDVTDSVFGKNNLGVPGAFGDFNSDELTDMFVINDRTVQVLFSSLKGEPLLSAINATCTFQCPVWNVVPGDYNGDALMDALVSIKCSEYDPIYNQIIVWGHLDSFNCTNTTLFKTHGQPLALDYNNDFITDLYGEDEDRVRTFWIFSGEKLYKKIKAEVRCGRNKLSTKPFRIPHSNAFLDFNNDCIADLFVVSGEDDDNIVFEMWDGTDEKDEKFKCEKILTPPKVPQPIKKMGQSLFLDVELRGKMDHILPLTLSDSTSKLFVYLNHTGDWVDLDLNLKDPMGNVWQWGYDSNVPLLQGITVRFGDFNMDGYPDLLAPLMSTSGQFKTVLLENIHCKICVNFTRTFEVNWGAFDPYGNDTVAGVFYDTFQDGVLDVVFVYKKADVYSMGAFKNNLDYDANFVRVMVSSGLKNYDFPFVVSPLRGKKRTFSSNLPGPRISYRTVDQEGHARKGASAQMPQSAHFALSLPYTTFALGRTPNFVDGLSVCFAEKSREWPQLIPNSQMVVIPFPIEEPWRWKAQLFVTPSKIILLSAVSLMATGFVLLAVIGALHWREKREDRIERLRDCAFSYDAM